MKMNMLRLALAAMAGTLLAVGSARAEPTGDKVTLKGEVVDLWCYLEGGDHGAEHKECGIACVKAGNPMGLVTAKGEIYVMMGIEDHQPGRSVLIEKMADVVTIEGILVKKGGTQVVYVSKVK